MICYFVSWMYQNSGLIPKEMLCMYVCMYVCVCVCMYYVSMSACMCGMCISMHIYISIFMYLSSMTRLKVKTNFNRKYNSFKQNRQCENCGKLGTRIINGMQIVFKSGKYLVCTL